MNDNEAAREERLTVDAWAYAIRNVPNESERFFEDMLDKAFRAGVEWADERGAQGARDEALRELVEAAQQVAKSTNVVRDPVYVRQPNLRTLRAALAAYLAQVAAPTQEKQ